MLDSDPRLRRRAEQEDPGSTGRLSPQLLGKLPVQGSLNGLIRGINATAGSGPVRSLPRLCPLDQHQSASVIDQDCAGRLPSDRYPQMLGHGH